MEYLFLMILRSVKWSRDGHSYLAQSVSLCTRHLMLLMESRQEEQAVPHHWASYLIMVIVSMKNRLWFFRDDFLSTLSSLSSTCWKRVSLLCVFELISCSLECEPKGTLHRCLAYSCLQPWSYRNGITLYGNLIGIFLGRMLR